MALNIIVCDDSKFARNQLIRVIPKSVIENLYQASNGVEAMNLMHEKKIDLLFLDLTMPVMDGYQVLEAIKKENIDVLTIVISGDIQQKAQQIISNYNTLAFLKKPLVSEELLTILQNYGLYTASSADENDNTTTNTNTNIVESDNHDKFDELKEKLNIAAGIASSKIGDYLNLFINMPVPSIKLKKGSDISESIKSWINMDGNILISHGFIGKNILGENLNFFSLEDIYSYLLMLGENLNDEKIRYARIIELSSLLSSSILSLAQQFNSEIKLAHPIIVSNTEINLSKEPMKSQDILCVEMQYEVKALKMKITNYILFTDLTTKYLKNLLAFV